MGGVYCPTCEAGVEVTAQFCLSCGHNLNVQGPITATGHDLNQLKDVIRIRDDLSMAEKFDMIAKIEDGADPIALGIAAAADDGGQTEAQAVASTGSSTVGDALRNAQWGAEAAQEAVLLATQGSKIGDLAKADAFVKETETFEEAMDLGRAAALHLLEVSYGAVLPAQEAMQSIPIMQPPNKSFCPKCGSDIQANALRQWQKWSDTSTEALILQLEAAMRASMMKLSATYKDKIQDLTDQLSDAKKALEKSATAPAATAEKPKKEASKKEEKKEDKSTKGKEAAATKTAPKKSTSTSKPKPKSGGLFGAKKPKKTYDGEPGGKAEWFLEEALDTVYDPHGTGKPIKGAMILARSSEGNVRVRDVVRTYAVEGEDGISELAWTNPITKYLIEAYEAC